MKFDLNHSRNCFRQLTFALQTPLVKKAILAILVLFTCSCKKDYTCTCTEPDGDVSTETFEDLKKKDVKAAELGCNLSTGFGTTCVWDRK